MYGFVMDQQAKGLIGISVVEPFDTLVRDHIGDITFRAENPENTNSDTMSAAKTTTVSVSSLAIISAPHKIALLAEAQAALMLRARFPMPRVLTR